MSRWNVLTIRLIFYKSHANLESKERKSELIIFFLSFSFDSLHNIADRKKCLIDIEGRSYEKAAGDIWNSSNDLCLKHTCEIGPNGIPIESTFREYCLHSCSNVCEIWFIDRF